jgi:hypothetical protein
MIKVSANNLENRLYMTLSGSIDLNDALETIRQIRLEVAKLEPGFDVINDIRFLKIANLQAALKIKQGSKIIENAGAKRVIRVVGSSTFAVKVFAKFSSLIGSKTKVHYVPTMEEAMEIVGAGELVVS